MRIIPARAGFTAYGVGHKLSLKDHPRSRGVYWSPGRPLMISPGSSPLARGLQLVAAGELALVRIIPARAGFTSDILAGAREYWDHPRSRGVYSWSRQASWPLSGSSPLARGLPPGCGRGASGCGIIPARAGFTIPGGVILRET